MITIGETETEVRQLLKAKFPEAKVSRIDIRERADSEGQPSYYIWIVLKASLEKNELKQTRALLDELRTWLSQNGDERFPYLSFITEKEEKELSSNH